MEITKYVFRLHEDHRGALVALEECKEIPFSIKRVYYMYGVAQNTARGFHAHKTLQQVLICVHGSCKVLLDNGCERETVVLDKPNEGLYVGHAMWREMYDFSPDAVLLVFASDFYDESDYIRDYDEFIRFVNGAVE